MTCTVSVRVCMHACARVSVLALTNMRDVYAHKYISDENDAEVAIISRKLVKSRCLRQCNI